MGYTASATMETYVIRRANEPGALATTGWQADGSININTAGEFDFVIADVHTLVVLFTMLKCKACDFIINEAKLGDACPACGVPRTAFETIIIYDY